MSSALSAVVHHELSIDLSRLGLVSRLGLDWPLLPPQPPISQAGDCLAQDGLPAARIQRRVEIERLLFATDRSQDSRAEWIELHWGKEKESVYFIIIINYYVVLCYQCRRPLVQT